MNLNEMSFDKLVPSKSKYLSKDDVPEDGLILTIASFKWETISSEEKGPEEKVVMYFEEDVKPMVLNRTNSQVIGVVTGCKTVGESKGKKIVVFFDPTVSFGGKLTGGLRIKKVAGAPKPAAPRKENGQAPLDDRIPF